MSTGQRPTPRTPEQARVPLLIFRKIHLYGKSKKSTHGHQTVKPFGPTELAAYPAASSRASRNPAARLYTQPRVLKTFLANLYPETLANL